MTMDRVVQRVNTIADGSTPERDKAMPYLVAILDTEIAALIRRDRNGESGLLRSLGYVDIAEAIDS